MMRSIESLMTENKLLKAKFAKKIEKILGNIAYEIMDAENNPDASDACNKCYIRGLNIALRFVTDSK